MVWGNVFVVYDCGNLTHCRSVEAAAMLHKEAGRNENSQMDV